MRNGTTFPGPLACLGLAFGMDCQEGGHVAACGGDSKRLDYSLPDYRPKYSKIDPEEGINPNHPNLTIWGSKIEVASFIDIHCHYANFALQIVRAGTNCLTIAFCHDIHEDAMLSVQDLDV